jgi:two-component system alkaline phosphatase synthesis response regulator PhoP
MPNKKVLVADDEVHIIQVVAIKLKNNGFEVITAENGQKAFELACAEKPDLVITDFQMPIMTGLEFIQKLRENSDTQAVPVIMLTARGFAIEDEVRENLKIAECLSKPFSPRELLQNVQNVLDQKIPA